MNRELHGDKTANPNYSRKQSDLMAAGVIWHDTTKKANDNDSPLKSQDLDAKHRMYQN